MQLNHRAHVDAPTITLDGQVLPGLPVAARVYLANLAEQHAAALTAQAHDLDEHDARFACLAPGHPARQAA
jgi:hypothetical protein